MREPAPARPPGVEAPRCLGSVSGAFPGPTVVITGGLHGNEPAGVHAARAVLDELGAMHHVLRGHVVAFSGNRAALAENVRFTSRDLNRSWHETHLEGLQNAPIGALQAEDLEQRELVDAFVELERQSRSLVFVDLHTTSGPTEPFASFADTGKNRRFASELPVAAVLGLEKVVGGTMLSWATGRGHVAMSFEAGQHEDPAARERHVSALWLLLVAAAAIDAERVPALEAHRAALAVASSGSRRIVEIRHRHVVGDDDEFEMVGKFETFETIEAGQIVARDRRGPVRSPESGLMLMPRYQGQGDDGFFVAREVSPADRTR